jgi:rhamnulokinase
MSHTANFLAADFGASSGRVMVGRWNGRSFSLDELHRFPNAGVSLGGGVYWDALGIWSHFEAGLHRYKPRFDDPPLGIGVDAWGVDFALLDRCGRLIGNPHHYRDARTDGVPSWIFERVAEYDIFAETGVQTMQINTLFQLFCMVYTGDPQLRFAETFLMIPDLYMYFLCGERRIEYTEATTTQMYSPARGDWLREMLSSIGIPLPIFSPERFWLRFGRTSCGVRVSAQPSPPSLWRRTTPPAQWPRFPTLTTTARLSAVVPGA